MMLLHTMVALDTRQATAPEAVDVDLSADSPGWHTTAAGAQLLLRPLHRCCRGWALSCNDVARRRVNVMGNDIAQAEIYLA
jgi:hypothetical protein